MVTMEMCNKYFADSCCFHIATHQLCLCSFSAVYQPVDALLPCKWHMTDQYISQLDHTSDTVEIIDRENVHSFPVP